LGHQSREARDIDPGRVRSRLRLTKVQLTGKPDFIAPSNEIVGGLLGSERGFGQFEPFPVGRVDQINTGNPGDERNLSTPTPLLGGKVLFQSLVLQAAEATEEIYLPGSNPQIDIELLDRRGVLIT